MFKFLSNLFIPKGRHEPSYKVWHAEPEKYRTNFLVSNGAIYPYQRWGRINSRLGGSKTSPCKNQEIAQRQLAQLCKNGSNEDIIV